jgi:hypothetical protein
MGLILWSPVTGYCSGYRLRVTGHASLTSDLFPLGNAPVRQSLPGKAIVAPSTHNVKTNLENVA